MTEFENNMKLATKLVGQGKVSRRDFMQLALAAGFTAAASNAMFVKAARAEPKKGGHLKMAVGHGQTTDSLDPATWTNGFTFGFGKSIMGAPLVQISQKNEPVPHLAESFEPADGAKKWIFKVRKGVTFHNGKTVTSDDIVATFNYHLGPDSKSPAKAVLSNVTAVKADGPETVIFELNGGNADFPFLVTDYHLSMYPSEGGKIQWEKGIGAGPFILKSFEPGVKLVGERNPNYFADCWFDSMELLSIIDVAARTNALLSGEIDFMDRVDLKTIDMLKGAPDVNIEDVAGFAYYNSPCAAMWRHSTASMSGKPSNIRSTAWPWSTRSCSAMARPAMTIRSPRRCASPLILNQPIHMIRTRPSSISRRLAMTASRSISRPRMPPLPAPSMRRS